MKTVLKETIQNLKHNLSLSVSSFVTIQIILILLSVFFMSVVTIVNVSDSFESKTQIHVQLNDDVNGEQIDLIKKEIESKYSVDIQYQSKAKELKKLIAYYGESGEFLDIYKDDNPLKNALLIKTKDTDKILPITEDLKDRKGVFSVNYGGAEVLKLTKTIDDAKNILLVFITIITLLISYILYHVTKLSILSRKDELFIKKETGISSFSIQAPFMVESVLFHLISIILPFLLCNIGYYFVLQSLNFNIFGITPLSQIKMSLYLLSFLFIFAFTVSLISAYFSSKKILNKLKS